MHLAALCPPKNASPCAPGRNLEAPPGVHMTEMRPNRLALLAVVASVTCLLVASAEAKFRMSVALNPAQPVAGSTASVIMRTDVRLPKNHGIHLFAVGPYRTGLGQAFLEIKLVRI